MRRVVFCVLVYKTLTLVRLKQKKFMKKLLVGVLAIRAFSSYASVDCKSVFADLSEQAKTVRGLKARLINIKEMDKRKLLSDHKSILIDLIEESVARHERSTEAFMSTCL